MRLYLILTKLLRDKNNTNHYNISCRAILKTSGEELARKKKEKMGETSKRMSKGGDRVEGLREERVRGRGREGVTGLRYSIPDCYLDGLNP